MTTVENLTVLGWLRNAGITEERARMHVAKGHVYADGVRVSDPDAPLAGAKIELRIPGLGLAPPHAAAGTAPRRRRDRRRCGQGARTVG